MNETERINRIGITKTQALYGYNLKLKDNKILVYEDKNYINEFDRDVKIQDLQDYINTHQINKLFNTRKGEHCSIIKRTCQEGVCSDCAAHADYMEGKW